MFLQKKAVSQINEGDYEIDYEENIFQIHYQCNCHSWDDAPSQGYDLCLIAEQLRQGVAANKEAQG